jgi:hypothetical protein
LSDPVRLNSELQFDEFVSRETATDIIDSRQFLNGNWKEATRQTNFPDNIKKSIIPVDISYAKFVVLTEVDSGSEVGPHVHDEPMLRLVLKGSFDLNGETYNEGDWVFVPAGIPYEMTTKDGYMTLGCYGQACTV